MAEDRKSEYAQKLRDPRWQKKRLEIFERDHWTCQQCMLGDETLHAHHLWYERNADPWDYPNDALLTLCESCHESEGAERRASDQDAIKVLRRIAPFNAELRGLASMLDRLDGRLTCGVAATFEHHLLLLIARMNKWDSYQQLSQEYLDWIRAQPGYVAPLSLRLHKEGDEK